MTSLNPSLRLRLSVMMFFQYMMFAVWWIPLAAYLANIGLSRNLTALVMSSMAFGSVFAPMVGMLADRYFRSNRLLAALNIGVALSLLFAVQTTQPVSLFIALLLAMIFYMPTWALTSAIALANAPSEFFPRIRVLGTVGWILAGGFSIVMVSFWQVDFDGTRLPFYFGAALAVITALTNLTLPATPPKGDTQKASLLEVMGFRSVVLLKDRNFAIFVVLFFFSMIPFAMYWSYFSEYLQDSGYRFITVTMSLGQVTEILILLAVPFFIRKIGLRKTMALGILALIVRYLALYLAGGEAHMPFVLLGVGVHGIIFGFYHLGAQIYTNHKAPKSLQSQAQGLIFFITFAPGLLVGNFACGWIIGLYSEPGATGVIYQWDSIWGITALMAVVVLAGFLVLFKEEDYKTVSL